MLANISSAVVIGNLQTRMFTGVSATYSYRSRPRDMKIRSSISLGCSLSFQIASRSLLQVSLACSVKHGMIRETILNGKLWEEVKFFQRLGGLGVDIVAYLFNDHSVVAVGGSGSP